jgi:myo-inositol 2-dehydrogenase / D-chiro-inositol 1-dehydrogenase
MQPEQQVNSIPSRRGVLKASTAAAAVAALGAVPFVHAAGTDTIKIGLVGCGGRGKGAVANAIESMPGGGVKCVAVGDLFEDVAKATKDEYDKRPKDKYEVGDRAFSGWDACDKVLATECNYVILATPPGFRPLMIEKAIAAGKHVFAEKPVAVDSTGVRRIIAAAQVAKEKNLGIVAGTQRRHQLEYIEAIKRIHDGLIGDVTSMNVYWMQEGLWVKPREPNWSDMEWQLRNWLYFTWLSGDHIVEQHMHQHDVVNWVLGKTPKFCFAMGGRQARVEPQFGHIYDHFAVEYEYGDGVKVVSMARQNDGTYGAVRESVAGTKGRTQFLNKNLEVFGDKAKNWRWVAPEDESVQTNPYVLEHKDLIESIRAGKPLNEGEQVAHSTLTAIMGRMAAYSGKLVKWADALNSPEDLMPKELKFGPMPVPPVAIPGKTIIPGIGGAGA